MKKAYFQYYETFETILEKIKDESERAHMRAVIINYGLHGIEPAELSELEEMAWVICKDLIDQQLHRRQVNAVNRSTKSKKEEEAKPAKQEEKPAEKNKKFQKPTLEEIKNYCEEKKIKIDAQQFFNYYESNGWKIGGRAQMKNWQAAGQNWSIRDKTAGKAAGTMWGNNSTDADTAEYEDLFI